MAYFGITWGILGITALLGSAIYRLGLVAHGTLSDTSAFGLWHWITLVVVTLFMAHSEGYRGFQQKFSPRVGARARYLRANPKAHLALLAPLFLMGYFHATKRRMIGSIALTCGIIVLVVLVRMLPHPWRGIVDFGVVVGLTWGLISLWYFVAKALGSETYDVDPETPESTQAPAPAAGAAS